MKGKFIFGFSILMLSSLFAVGAFNHWQSTRMGRAHALALVQDDVGNLGARILSRLDLARESLLTLYSVPPIEAIMRARSAHGIDPESGDSLDQLKQRLRKIFTAFLQHGNKFQQLRYIDDTGRELVRMDVTQGKVYSVPDSGLQNKAHRDYFRQAMQLQVGEIYIGDMTLNREHGRITISHALVLRLAMPLFDAAGQTRGLLVANVRSDYLLAPLISATDGAQNYLLNENGYFLRHPDPSKLVGFKYAQNATVGDEFPAIFPAMKSMQYHAGSYPQADGDNLVESFETIYFNPRDHNRYWVLLRTVPEALLLKNVTVFRDVMLWSGLVIAGFVLLLVSLIVTRKIMRPITLLVDAAQRLQQGDLSVRLPADQVKDEFRMLYRMVNSFVEQQKYATEHLESEVAARTAQLIKQGDEIQQKNKELESSSHMKSQFLANMSHELRTPLNAIIGFSEIIKDGAAGDLNDDQRSYIGEVYESGKHLLELINEILDLSKVEAGKMELDLCDVIVPDLLENSFSMVREQAMKHGVSLHMEISDDVGCCQIDMRKLKQILYNLLSNAVKFTPDGGSVHLTAHRMRGKAVKVENDEIHASVSAHDSLPDADFLEISVVDTGIGIAREDLKKLFQPFVQLDGSLSRRYEGTGLGLILVKAMVELHGGTVSVESEAGKGSTFTVSIPCRQADDEAETETETSMQPRHEAPARPANVSGGKPLALIIEDDYASAELMRLKMEKHAFQTERAATAEGALYWLESHAPDLIVLDIMLPLTTGWEFMDTLKHKIHGSDIPVIMVSGVAEDHAQKGRLYEVAAMLQKPVDEAALIEALTALGFARDTGE